MLSSAFRHALCDLYGSLLNRSTTINLYMVLKDMQGILMLSKTVPTLSRVAALEVSEHLNDGECTIISWLTEPLVSYLFIRYWPVCFV